MNSIKGAIRGALAAAVLLAACSGITVNARTAPNTNLQKYHTYGWYTPPDQPQGQPMTPAQQEVRTALEQNLAAKGFTPAAQDQQPDFLVATHAKRQEKTDVTPVGYGYPYSWYGAPGYNEINTYTVGTLVVDFIDPTTNSIFWRGTASSVVPDQASPDAKKIDEAVAKLMDKYPAMTASAPRQQM